MFSNPTPSEPRLSPAATISDDMLSALTQPLHWASILQLATPPQVVAFECWTISAPCFLNRFTFAESRKPDLWTCVCVCILSSSAFAFLIKMNFSVKSLDAIWLISPQQFLYYFNLCMVSWQYQKCWTILILVLCLLCVSWVVCSSYSSFTPSSPFLSSWWQKDCELFTHQLVLQGSPSTSSGPPQTTHVFADSRIGLLCHALHIWIAHAPPESCVSCLLVHWLQACYKNLLSVHQKQICLDDTFALLISLSFLHPQKIFISVRWLFELSSENV